MTGRYPILRSLDPYHQRLGYLNGVVLCAIRGLDSREALAARFYELMFDRVSEDDPRWSFLFGRVAKDKSAELLAGMAKAREDDPTSVLLRGRASGWLFTHELWLNANEMYSHLGGLTNEPDKALRPVEFAKWLELILPTYELSEQGIVVRTLLEQERSLKGEHFNPLRVRGLPLLQLIFIRLLLRAECLFPHLLRELADPKNGVLSTRGDGGLLRTTVQRLLDAIGEPTRPDEILDVQNVYEFRDSIAKSRSTEENYLRPRMEILVDLTLVDRGKGRKPSDFPWVVTESTRRAAQEWSGLASGRENADQYLDKRFFSSMATVYGRPVVRVSDPLHILREFATAFGQVGREFGFTPARTVALLTCLRAWGANKAIEVADVMKTVADAAGSSLGRHLQLSGGSRFDEEYLIRVSPNLLAELGAPAI